MIIIIIALGFFVGSSYNEKNVKKTTKDYYDAKIKETPERYKK